MGSDNDLTNVPNDDSAAVAAASAFWSDSDRQDAAQKEVPDSAPTGVMSTQRRDALANEYADQRMELEQSEALAPGEADGTPVEKPKQPVTKTVAGKTAVAATPEKVEADGVDPVLRSIAQDAGWTDEKIDRFYAADAELAQETFEQLADQYANLSRQFVQVAPASQAATTPQVQPAQVQQPIKGAGELPPALTDDGLKKFAEANGQESADLVKAIRDHFVSAASSTDARIAKFEALVKEADTRVTATEANSTIATLREKFPAIYGAGDDPRTLTVGQYQKTVELAALADQIRAGARAQGRTLTVKDAITRAHYIVSRDSVKTEAREEIVKQVKNRSQRATAKPSQRNNPAAPGQSKGDSAAVAAAASKMAEIGMNDE